MEEYRKELETTKSKLKHSESGKREHEVEAKSRGGSEDVSIFFLTGKRNQRLSMRSITDLMTAKPKTDTSCI
jgi:hypothetical protein